MAGVLPPDQRARVLEIAKAWEDCANAAEAQRKKGEGGAP